MRPRAVNGTRTRTLKRRTKTETGQLRELIRYEVEQHQPMTVRQVYYRMVAAGVIRKTHNEYRTVQQQLLWLRRHQVIPYTWITDNTRYRLRSQYLFPSITDALQSTIDHYRHDLWANTPAWVEIWAESDAVAGVLFQEADTWGVPVLVFRGYNSATFL
jgi:hypothetical protein